MKVSVPTRVAFVAGFVFAGYSYAALTFHANSLRHHANYADVDRSIELYVSVGQQKMYERAVEQATIDARTPLDWMTLGAHFHRARDRPLAYHAYVMASLVAKEDLDALVPLRMEQDNGQLDGGNGDGTGTPP